MSAAPPLDASDADDVAAQVAVEAVEGINPFLPPDLHETVQTQDAATAAAEGLAEEEAAAAAVPAEAEETAVAAAAARTGEVENIPSVAEDLKDVREQQREQARLIESMQSTIEVLIAKQSELDGEIRDLKGGRWVVRAEPVMRPKRKVDKDIHSQASASAPLISLGTAGSGIEGDTEDAEIDHIIALRKEKKVWPLKRKYCTSFTNEVDLLKLRFHRSAKHAHKYVRIPKVDKSEGYGLGNREGRLICRLCSGKTINRNTSWMCATCCVPLCIDITNSDPDTSCHARWHGCQDLVAVNQTLNRALRERRESKKRSRDAMNEADAHVSVKMEAGDGSTPATIQGGEVLLPLEVPNAGASAEAIHQAAAMAPPPEVPHPLQVDEMAVDAVRPKVEVADMVQIHEQQPVDLSGEVTSV